MGMTERRVMLVSPGLPHYRRPFHEHMRALLADAGCRYDLVHGSPPDEEATRDEAPPLEWAHRVRNRSFGLPERFVLWQPVLRRALAADLVIINQENRFLANYLLQLWPGKRPLVALWGHGRNFQARDPRSLRERWKRHWARRADWWFAYTDETRRHVEALGFASDRITVFQNSIDTVAYRRLADAVRPARIAARRAELGLRGENVAIFVGRLYPDKRLDFLVDAADRIRAAVSDFELIVVGGGAEADALAREAERRPWLKPVGRRYDADKAELMRCARLFVMPGLLGLAVLDANAAGLPVVATDFPWHSPEIAYLEDGVTGRVVPDWRSPQAYADAVIELLHDRARLDGMAQAARACAADITIEAMAERFAGGVLAALAAGPRR